MDNLIAVIPSIGAAILFFFVIRYFLRADRIEREEMSRLDEETGTTFRAGAVNEPQPPAHRADPVDEGARRDPEAFVDGPLTRH